MRLGVCCEPFVDEWGLEATVERAADVGYDGIELTAWDVSDDGIDASGDDIEEAKRIANDHGVDIIGLYRYFPEGTDRSITHPDPDVRSRTVEDLRRVIDLCDRLGGSVIVFGAPETRGTEGLTPGEARANARDSLTSDPLAATLEAAGVTLCVEPLTWKSDLFATARETAMFVADIDHPNVRTMVDGYHLLAETGSPEEVPGAIERYGEHVGHVHADDASLHGPGGGDLEWGPIVESLRDVGYDGYVSVELHDVYVEGEAADRGECLQRSGAYLREVLDRSGA